VRLLVTGATGYVGGVLLPAAGRDGWQVVATHRATPPDLGGVEWVPLDVTDRAAVLSRVRAVRPDAIVHLASITSHPEPDRVWRVTAEGAAHVAAAATEVGARLVHVSTDAVHPGGRSPYDESAVPRPVHVYGAAKAGAEEAVREIAPGAAVVRCALVVSPVDGPECPHETLTRDLIAGRVDGALYTDEIRCPVFVDDLSAALLELARSSFAGVINVAGADAASRYELGVAYARLRGLDPAAIPVSTIAERVAAGGTPRPGDVRLDTALARRILRTELRGVRESGLCS
jgi:dTDP-4-dehydrorhamnose reductase